MKKLFLVLILSLFLISCGSTQTTSNENNDPVKISALEGKTMMDDDDTIILIDVRTLEEYNSGHITNSILLPVDNINTLAASVIPDKNAIYIVYCRSGNRSATAVTYLHDLGYVNLYDMGGIINWPYDIVTS